MAQATTTTATDATRRLRVLYAAGPGDVIGTYQFIKAGRDDPSQVAHTFSGQFFRVCRDLDLEALVIANHKRRDSIKSGRFEIEHRPVPFAQRGGLLYHLGQVWWGLRLIASAVRFRADVAVVSDWSHWFVLSVLPFLGVRVVPALLCVMWPTHRPMSRSERILRRLNRGMFARHAYACLSMSRAITRQMRRAAKSDGRRVIEFLPTYRRATFEDVAPPPELGGTFRVLYVGRIEHEKGVFDLLQVAERFEAEGRTDVVFDLCGAGGAFDELTRCVQAAGLTERFRCHGHCDRPTMRGMFGRAHAVIVPTRTDFVEGFNMVVAEAVLSGRPVITSTVCPALEYVGEAAMEVEPDDPAGYGDAILALQHDGNLYRAKCEACERYQAQFYDEADSFGGGLMRVLMPLVYSDPGMPVFSLE